jgi:hypothetical protein
MIELPNMRARRIQKEREQAERASEAFMVLENTIEGAPYYATPEFLKELADARNKPVVRDLEAEARARRESSRRFEDICKEMGIADQFNFTGDK